MKDERKELGKMRNLSPCPSGTNTKHTPYIANWEKSSGGLNIKTAQVRCYCGFSGPERYGDTREKKAVYEWNTRKGAGKDERGEHGIAKKLVEEKQDRRDKKTYLSML